MALLIIADASPLIGLAKIGQLDLLPKLYKQVTIPPAVRDEICPMGDYAGAQVLSAALEADWLVVAPSLDALSQIGYRLSKPLVKRLLELAGEAS